MIELGYRFGLTLGMAVILAGCGATSGQPTPTLWVPPTTVPTSIPVTVPSITTAPTIEPIPSASPTIAGVVPTAVPETMIAIRTIIASRSVDQEKVNATLTQLLSQPVPGGEAVVFHWEDSPEMAPVSCTGYAVAQHLADGTSEVQGMAAGCANKPLNVPMAIYAGQGRNISGESVTVIFGEIFDPKIVQVRAIFNSSEFTALVHGSGYMMELPPADVSTAVVTGYDAADGAVFSGSPSLGQ